MTTEESGIRQLRRRGQGSARWPFASYPPYVSSTITVHSLTPERFDDFAAVLGTSGISGCWCMYWVHPTTKSWGEASKGGAAAANRDLFRAVIDAGPPPGLLAYDGDAAVGWCRVMPRDRLPGLGRSRAFSTDLDVAGVWSLSCLVIRRSHRGRGISGKLIEAAVGFAADQGARILEAYPWDGDDTKSPSSLWTGVASTFARHGFEVVQRKQPQKPMMRYDLSG